jgi:hypothetical protein
MGLNNRQNVPQGQPAQLPDWLMQLIKTDPVKAQQVMGGRVGNRPTPMGQGGSVDVPINVPIQAPQMMEGPSIGGMGNTPSYPQAINEVGARANMRPTADVQNRFSAGSFPHLNDRPTPPVMPQNQSLQGQLSDADKMVNQGMRDRQRRPEGLMGYMKNMGQGMNGYMGKLFNDPNRMAMLQGGLSMMDPNSYYDKQGFGSAWTGLNRGLGAAQAGHKGVMDRREATLDRKLKGAKTATELLKAYDDEISIASTNSEVMTLNKSLAGRLKRHYMEQGDSEVVAYRKAQAQATSKLADKGMKGKDEAKMRESYIHDELTLKKIKEAKALVTPANMSFGAAIKRFTDKGLTFAQIAHDPSSATKLKTMMDELAFPMMQSIMGIPLNSKLLDSKAEKDFIKELAGNPTKYTDPTILIKKLEMIEGLYTKQQAHRRKELGYNARESDQSLGSKYDY